MPIARLKILLLNVGITFILGSVIPTSGWSQSQNTMSPLAGVVITDKNESVEGATVIVRYASGEQRTVTDAQGGFHFTIPGEPLSLRVEGKNLDGIERNISRGEATENLEIRVRFTIPRVHESVVIQATALDPSVDRRDDAVYKSTLFSRDDQVLQTLNAGINARPRSRVCYRSGISS